MTISTAISTTIAIEAATRMPVNTNGDADGKLIRRITPNLPSPKLRAVCFATGSTEAKPVRVLNRMGHVHAMSTTTDLLMRPRWKTTIRSGA